MKNSKILWNTSYKKDVSSDFLKFFYEKLGFHLDMSQLELHQKNNPRFGLVTSKKIK